MYTGCITSKSSALSMNVLLIFEIQETNNALFLNPNFLSYASLFGFVTVIVPFTTIYRSLKSNGSDLSIDFLNPICLLALYALLCLVCRFLVFHLLFCYFLFCLMK